MTRSAKNRRAPLPAAGPYAKRNERGAQASAEGGESKVFKDRLTIANAAVADQGGRVSSAQAEILPAEQRKVVFTSSLGTVFEWYDFYLYGSLAAIIGEHFFSALTWAANPELAAAAEKSPITFVANPATCRFRFNPVGQSKFTSPCDVAKSALVEAGVPYSNVTASGAAAQIKLGATVIEAYDAAAPGTEAKADEFNAKLTAALKAAGYPPKSKLAGVDWNVVGLLTILVIYVTMVYGPMAAFLVELFPTRIRYSAMSLPYHIGNGWFGGFLPTTAFAMVAATGDIYYGLWYPIVVAAMTLIVGLLLLHDTKGHHLTRDDEI